MKQTQQSQGGELSETKLEEAWECKQSTNIAGSVEGFRLPLAEGKTGIVETGQTKKKNNRLMRLT